MILSIFLVFLGTGLLAFSSYSIYRIIALVGKKRRTQVYWSALFFLTLFFVFGYLGAIAMIAAQWLHFLIYLVGMVFFFGAFFVFLVTRIGLRTITDMATEVQVCTQELRLACKAAEKANEAKSNFLAIMSHEIRTPLSSIIATVDIMEEFDLQAEVAHYMNIINRAGRNLLNQINDILDFSKIEAGRLELEKVPILLNDSIQNVLSIMEVRCKEKEIFLKSEIDIPQRLTVNGDAGRIEQILINLIGNAIKFTLKGGLSLRIKPIEENENEIVLSFAIADSGVGIPSDKIEKVFESFSQADSGVSRRFGGTGLGLTICKTLVEIMGGQIQIKSALNVGTTFSFDLCLEKSQEYLEPKRAIEDPGIFLTEMRILLVEDNEDNRFLFQAFFKSTDIHLDLAENGAVAVRKVLRGSYDLIFMDIQMPVMDGFTAMRRIRQWEKRRKFQPIPIVALTASSTKEDVMKSFACGCTEYLSKPIRKKALLEAVSRYAYKKTRTLRPTQGTTQGTINQGSSMNSGLLSA